MACPQVYQAHTLVKNTNGVQCYHETHGWVPARPLGWQGLGLRRRLRATWLVFTGEADAVLWY